MSSKVDICNAALTRLAASRIISLGDSTVSAKDCNAIFDIVAEDTMSLGAWSSCLRRASLAQNATAPAFGYAYQYTLPTDPKFIRLIELNETKVGEIPFSIEGNQILTDESTLKIRYIAYLEDTNSYDVFLRQAIIDRLVAELVYKVTGSLSAYQAAFQYAMGHARQLLASSSEQQHSREVNSDTFIDARLGNYPREDRLRD